MDVNEAGIALINTKKDLLINRCFSLFITPDSQGYFSRHRQDAIKTLLPQTCEIKILKWNGSFFHARLDSKAMINEETNELTLLTCIIDITAKKSYENYLHQEQAKLAMVERLKNMSEVVAIIAREQNHILTIINNYLSGCILRLKSENYNNKQIIPILKSVASHCNRFTEVTHRIQNYTTKRALVLENANINTVINETIYFMENLLTDFPINVKFEPYEMIKETKIDKLQIKHVLINLARNAIEAMHNQKNENPQLMLGTKQIDETTIEVSMLDNGPGFEQEIAHKLFDATFSTKHYNVGLGLTVGRSIIEKHGGTLHVELSKMGGVLAYFRLPCSKQNKVISGGER